MNKINKVTFSKFFRLWVKPWKCTIRTEGLALIPVLIPWVSVNKTSIFLLCFLLESGNCRAGLEKLWDKRSERLKGEGLILLAYLYGDLHKGRDSRITKEGKEVIVDEALENVWIIDQKGGREEFYGWAASLISTVRNICSFDDFSVISLTYWVISYFLTLISFFHQSSI